MYPLERLTGGFDFRSAFRLLVGAAPLLHCKIIGCNWVGHGAKVAVAALWKTAWAQSA